MFRRQIQPPEQPTQQHHAQPCFQRQHQRPPPRRDGHGQHQVAGWAATTKLTGDMVPVNDTVTLELRVVTLPATLTYDSGTPTSSSSWLGAGGMGACFIPPVYPCSISAIRQHMTSTGSVNVLMAIFSLRHATASSITSCVRTCPPGPSIIAAVMSLETMMG